MTARAIVVADTCLHNYALNSIIVVDFDSLLNLSAKYYKACDVTFGVSRWVSINDIKVITTNKYIRVNR